MYDVGIDDVAPACVFASTVSPCEGELVYAPDPYDADVKDDFTPVWMCERHRFEVAQDI